jgi:hypothetical protein
MNRVILITSTIFIMAILSFAQKAFANGYFVQIALPDGNSSIDINPGFGGTGYFEINLDPNATFEFEMGLLILRGQQEYKDLYGSGRSDFSAIILPLQIGIRYYIGSNESRFYFGGLIGFHDFVYDNSSSKSVSFRRSAAPIVGYQMSGIELSARYQFVSDDFSYLGLGVGINF